MVARVMKPDPQLAKLSRADRTMVDCADALITVALNHPEILNDVHMMSELMPLRWQQDAWAGINQLWDAKSQLDLIVLAEHLDTTRKEVPTNSGSWLAHIGGVMMNCIASPATVSVYVEKLVGWQRRARCSEIGQKLIAATVEGEDGSDDAIRELMAMDSLNRTMDGPISESIPEAVDYLDARFNNRGKVHGVSYGLSGLDKLLSGMEPSHLITLAARPAMGKTALALCIAATNRHQPVGFISTEQPRREMINRLVSIFGGVDSHKMRTGDLTDEDWVKLTHTYAEISSWPLYMNDKAAPVLSEVVRQARKWKHRYGIKLLIVDYMQRIKVPKADSRAQEVGEIASTLKNVARELEIPVLALSQINRGVESRGDKRPMMSDLRESGDIEQESDIIITLYRDEVYHNGSTKGEVELATIKNRHGPIGLSKCHYEGRLLRFEDFGLDGGPAPEDDWDRGEPRSSGRIDG